ncbi:Ig-like domain-containing protein [Bacillus sp. BRMEA1]|uniref:alpha-amylase family glycosyl hydrolase n=1 Tax=Neobacillus endophyticus TaxID=2738405 RepID=UPI0015668651|nr:alpha-amylase family glycosyl hydrolase [Neobacillus endophyticus]NRD76860.1 Ig-like domain-containing protein [Neobacillus endophyticus]
MRKNGRTISWFSILLLLLSLVSPFGMTSKADTLVNTGPVVNADRTVTFQYQGDTSTTSVHLAGDMNGWSLTANPMIKDATNLWSFTTPALSPGKHQYKFVLNGSNWITDPQNPNQMSGNSIVYVPGFYAITADSQIQQGATTNVTALGLKADGTDETLTGVTWGVSPSNAATIDANGVLTANKLQDGVSSLPITITGEKDGVKVTKGATIVQTLTEQPGGKQVVLVGDIQSIVQKAAWDPASSVTRMLYQGNGLYKITLKNIPSGNYQYKVALGGSWAENYGANGASNGGNIPLTVPQTEDVTFYYSDTTHLIVDSTTYTAAAPVLSGTGLTTNPTLMDYNLTGVYSTVIHLPAGNYNDLVIKDGNKTVKMDPFTVDTAKNVTISYDIATGIVFNDLSNIKVSTADLYFNSKDSVFKSIYGAVPTGNTVTFNLRAKKDDLTKAFLVLTTPSGTQVIDMHKNGTFNKDTNHQYDRWTADYSCDTLGLYQYYFAVTNGSDVKAYGDDDGYYGPGMAGDLGKVGKYDMNVYDQNFKTPDWLKNAVIYQIFPDRFFNGDTSNDFAQKIARGSTPYEFEKNWYSIPEDPAIEFTKDANGKTVVDPNYKANIGDGIFNNDVFGGDLKGIQDKLNYLKALGVNTLYLNPIFASSSNHKYDTRNYTEIDPMLGHMDDYVNLVTAAHKMGMHLILDGVFNHVSDDSIYFDRYGKYVQADKPIGAYQYWSRVYDLLNTNGGMTQAHAEQKVQQTLKAQGITDFHYKDWFLIQNKKVPSIDVPNTEVYYYGGWNGNESLPEIQALNNSEYTVTSWANEVLDGPNADSKYWLQKGANGWRLDAADSVSDDTWKHFRPAVKAINSDDVIIGEIWGDSSKYLLGNMFDSVMNYRFRGAVQEFVTGSADALTAMNDLEKMREQYPKEAFLSLMNLVDSHDTERIISDLDGIGSNHAVASAPSSAALAKMKLVPFIQMTYPGAPTIYYGDEIGMPGATDPDCRRPMTWGKGNKDLVMWYAKLANIRNAYPVLRTGDIVPLQVDSSYTKDVLAYTRNDDKNHAVVVANRAATTISSLKLQVSSIPDGTTLVNALNKSEKYTVQRGTVTVDVPAQSGIILMAKYSSVHVNTESLKDAFDAKFIVPDRIEPTGVTINPAVTLGVGHQITLIANVTPIHATVKAVTWSSNNEKAAKVDANGIVTGVGEGKAVITVTTVDGGITATCTVTVKGDSVKKE